MESMPRTVEDVFKDYRNRRSGICKALTADVEEFHRQCDPEKENLCLYGHPNESWEVSLPVEEVPPELPEPALGINFAREGMPRREWLSLVAVHSDAWLLAVASFYAACFDRNERKRLFNLINELPTVLEVVTGRKSTKEKTSSVNNGSGNKTKPTAKMPPPQQRASEVPVKPPPQLFPSSKDEEEEDEEEGEEEDEGPEGEGGEEEEDEHGETYCGTCSGPYEANEFWICCDLCERWYHGKCVKITPARAEHIKQYKCPLCQNNKRPRPGM